MLAFVPTTFCELSGCLVGLWVRSEIQRSRSEVSHFVFLGRVELGVPKLGHRCALKLWKGSGREPEEDKERMIDLDPGGTPWLRPDGVGGFRVA